MRLFLAIGLGALLASAACYTIPGSDLAARYDTIFVPVLENRTFEPGLHTRVSDALRREFQHDGQLRLVNTEAEADLILTGALTGFDVRASAFDKQDRPFRFAAYITGQVSVRETQTKDVIWKKEVKASDFFQTQRFDRTPRARGRAEGVEEASEEFAELVVFNFVDSAW